MSDISFENIDWNRLGDPGYLVSLGVDPVTANTLPQGAPPGPTTVGGLAQTALSGRAVVLAILRDAGLDVTPELDGYITNLTTNFGNDLSRLGAVVNADLYDTGSTLGKVVDQKYPELRQRIANGHAPGTVGEALQYRTTAAQYARAEGLPPELLDPGKLYAADVSLPEVHDRLSGYYRSVQAAAPDVVQQLHTLYGFTPGQIGALAVNPDYTEQHLVNQFNAAQVGAAGVRSGFGQIAALTAEQLASQGVSADEAQAGFGTLAAQSGLFSALPGSGEDVIDQTTQIAAQFSNDAAAKRRIKNREAQRLATFQGGGGFGAGSKGVTGLGLAETA